MTITEAIIYLSIQIELKHRLGKDFEANALQLAIEALKFTKGLRNTGAMPTYALLPGETEE